MYDRQKKEIFFGGGALLIERGKIRCGAHVKKLLFPPPTTMMTRDAEIPKKKTVEMRE